MKRDVLVSAVAGLGGFSLADLVSCVLGYMLALQNEHWQTQNYARHKAVEKIQEDMEDALDEFVEAYIGMVGGERPQLRKTITECSDPDEVISKLKAVSLNDTALLNLRDEMLGLVYKHKYLKSLS